MPKNLSLVDVEQIVAVKRRQFLKARSEYWLFLREVFSEIKLKPIN